MIHPYDGAVLDTVPVGAPEDISAALDGLEQGATAMRALPTHRRVEILRRTAQLMAEQQEDLACLISREEGKVLAEGRIEAGRAMETLDLSADAARDLHGETVPLDATLGGVGKLGFTLRVPCGIVAAITPFNFPLNLVAHKIGPAIAGGNAVLLKPASDTPLSALKLVELLLEAGCLRKPSLVSPALAANWARRSVPMRACAKSVSLAAPRWARPLRARPGSSA